MEQLEGYVARYQCQTCGGKWIRKWRAGERGHNIGAQFCPQDATNHKYIEWTNFAEFCDRYVSEIQRMNER